MDDNIDPEKVTLLHRLLGYWKQKGVRVRPGVSLQQIESFESRYLIRLPSDLRDYHGTIGE